jgi:hypothetical protein
MLRSAPHQTPASFPDVQLHIVDAPLGAGPEFIFPVVVMDFGLAQERAPNDGRISIRDTSGICSRRRVVICPSGGLSTGLSSPLCKNISLHPSGKSSLQIRAIPPHKRGVS